MTEAVSSATCRVRGADRSDLASLGALFEAAFSEPFGQAAIDDLTKPQGSFALIAEGFRGGADPVPLGFCIASVAHDEAEIFSIGVSPLFRRCGVGAELLDAVCARARNAGAVALFLEVGDDNPGAVAFYTRLGFKEVGRRRNYYRRGKDWFADALIMRKDM